MLWVLVRNASPTFTSIYHNGVDWAIKLQTKPNQYSNYRREAALVDSVERFLSLALRSTLIKEGLGPSTQEFEELKETVKNMNCKLKNSLYLTLVLLNQDIPCLCKQCRFRSVGF